MESITGITNGSDCDASTNLLFPIQLLGCKGEEIVDSTTWLIKSHYPALLTAARPFDVNKVILCVRNPIDVMVSQYLLVLTWTHTEKVK